MYHIGQKIKYFRIQKGLTQTELAEGIISFSYLSKIESGSTMPNPEITGLLCKKLGIDPNVITEFDADFEKCKQWFKSLLSGDRNQAKELFEEIDSQTELYSSELLVNLIEINKLRYFMLTNQADRAAKQLQNLLRIKSTFNKLEKYYFYKFRGEYFYSKCSYYEALELFQSAENLIHDELFYKEEEISNLFYLIGNTASKIRQVHIAFPYALEALKYYQSQYDLFRCAYCHILLGICYRRNNEVEKAKESYEMAIKIGVSLNNPKLISLSNQNIGALYSSIGDHMNAIEHFKKSYETHPGTYTPNINILTPISSLMKEYYKMRDYPNAIFWLQKGKERIETEHMEKSSLTYDFEIYEQLLLHHNGHQLEKILLNEVFPYLEKNRLYYQKQIYFHLLADHYYDERRYKQAAKYYRKANHILKSIYNE
ncbi:helix-turn-helix domain-containing protein [Ornithinibacillus halotolerans]|uniref:Transcriptional regulator n=1 Tax=Ornithinibacillus halotolerans TaxID=1274357 RepID=A0A916WER1_9BACI|nr:helix-turn-helix transcriptional regulator [Ornithinibacillus halotolerans]GGA91061.1 transcriptional regulator [Ornithinibacillus halotolerans]